MTNYPPFPKRLFRFMCVCVFVCLLCAWDIVVCACACVLNPKKSLPINVCSTEYPPNKEPINPVSFHLHHTTTTRARASAQSNFRRRIFGFVWCGARFLFCLLILACNVPESATGRNRGWLRSHRNIGTDRQSGPRLYGLRHGVASLVRYAGRTASSDCSMAHSDGSGRWREEGLRQRRESSGKRETCGARGRRIASLVLKKERDCERTEGQIQ